MEFAKADKVYRAYYDELVILLGTGLRISELCGLTIADVDLEKNIISVDHQLLRTDKIGRYAGDPKTRCGIRQVYMGPEVQEAFRHVLARPHVGNIEVNGYTDFLFRARTGNPRTATDYDNIFHHMREKHAKKYGPVLPENMTPHTMRHTFCTNMAHAGMNPKALQYVMGHADIKITMGYYAHTDPVAATDNMRRTLEEPASVA